MTTWTEMAPVPTPGVIASLRARTWIRIKTDGDVEEYNLLLITSGMPRDRTEGGTELQMRGVAAALGLAGTSELIPDVGERVVLRRGDLLIRFDGTDYAMRLRLPTEHTEAMAQLGRMLLAVGLDPLDPHADLAAADTYIDEATRAGRMYFGSARVSAL